MPLGRLAAIRVTQGPPSIRTENAELVAYLYVDMHGRDIGGFVAEADRAVRDARDPGALRAGQAMAITPDPCDGAGGKAAASAPG